jgi:hypothetical protein
MFGRRPKPVLKVILSDHNFNLDGSESISFSILNEGRTIAKYIGLMMTLDNVSDLKASSPIQNISHLNSGRPVIQYADNINVIHPNTLRISIGYISFKRADPDLEVTLEVSTYCEGQKSAKENHKIPPTSAGRSPAEVATFPAGDRVRSLTCASTNPAPFRDIPNLAPRIINNGPRKRRQRL